MTIVTGRPSERLSGDRGGGGHLHCLPRADRLGAFRRGRGRWTRRNCRNLERRGQTGGHGGREEGALPGGGTQACPAIGVAATGVAADERRSWCDERPVVSQQPL